MPPVVAGIAVYFAVSAAMATFILVTAVITAASLAYSAYAMASMPGYSSDIAGRTQIVRSAVAPHRVVYGECMVSGPLVAAFSYGTNNWLLYLVIVLTSHEVEEIGDVYLEDTLCTDWTLWNMGGETVDTLVIPANGQVVPSYPVGTILSVTQSVAEESMPSGFEDVPIDPSLFTLVDSTFDGAGGAPAGTSVNRQINFDLSLAGSTITISYYRSLVQVVKYLGTQNQAADPELMANARDASGSPCWTSAHTLTGRAYMVVRLEYNTTAFSSGIPNIKAVVKGVKDIVDPRLGKAITNVISGTMRGMIILDHVQIECPGHGFTDGQTVYVAQIGGAVEANGVWAIGYIDADNFYLISTSPPGGSFTVLVSAYTAGGVASSVPVIGYSNNAALCTRDYLLKSNGLQCTPDDINENSFIAAANICDEVVDVLAGTGTGYTTDNRGYDVGETVLHLISGAGTILPGDNVTVTVIAGWYKVDTGTGAHLYSPTAADGYTEHLASADVYTVASSSAYSASIGLDAFGNLTLAGSGLRIAVPPLAMAVTVNPVSPEPRYTCNGSFTLDKTPSNIIKNMLTACAGRLVWSQGQYSMFPAAYNYPIVTLTESDLRDAISVTPAPSLRQRMNTVRGTFVSPADYWQQIDFPFQRDDIAYGLDRVELPQNLELPYTTSSATAQRLANIFLQQTLHGMIVHFPGKLTCFRLQPGDVIYLNIALLGWVEKIFRVQEWTMADTGGVDLVLREESPEIYGWISSQQATVNYPPAAYTSAPGTNPLPTYAGNAAALSGGLTAGHLYRTTDGIAHVVY